MGLSGRTCGRYTQCMSVARPRLSRRARSSAAARPNSLDLGAQRRLLTGLLVAIALSAFATTPASAHKRFARKLGVECKECHESPEGGGPRHLIGQYYQATSELPVDRSPETMKLVESTVDRWLLDLLSVPPTIRWRRTALDDLETTTTPSFTPAANYEVLRRLSLDLRGTAPTAADLEALEEGKPLEQFVDAFLASDDFRSTFFLYHKDIVRPRTGIFNTAVSFSRIAQSVVDGQRVWYSERLPQEPATSGCRREETVKVSPWWDRNQTIAVCAASASTKTTAKVAGKTLRCDSDEGQRSGQCGCGPHLVHCYVDSIKKPTIDSMKDEMAEFAMSVVQEDRPYTDVLTADWTMLDGKLEVFYAKLWGTQSLLTDADAGRDWHKVERGPHHSGVLSSPAMLNFFYNGRRWAQRTMESFFCHEVTPDFDLLDDTVDAGHTVAIPYRDSPDLMPTQNVTEGRACAACHLQLDAVARVKDRWDYFGGYFETMPGERPLPIPQQVWFEGALVDGIDGLGHALAQSETFHDCVVNQAWEHMTGHRFTSSETATRRALLARFRQSGMSFKTLLRAIIDTPYYQSKENLKLMRREQYLRAMGRATDVAWRPYSKKQAGWDLYYDKVGGMDYRKIEFRDVRPGQGHSMVLFKGAAESCSILIDREKKRGRKERVWLDAVSSVDSVPDEAAFNQAVDDLFARAYGRPADAITDADRTILRNLFDKVRGKHGPDDGWRAVCTAIFGAEDYAIY